MEIDLPGYDLRILRSNKVKRLLGIDVSQGEDMSIRSNANFSNIGNVLHLEYLQTTKNIFHKVFLEKDKIEIDDQGIEDIFRSNTPVRGIITNGNVGSELTDHKDFKNIPLNRTTNGMIYRIGQINGIVIYVDPYMKWDDVSLYVIKGPIFCFSQPVINGGELKFKCIYEKNYIDNFECYSIKSDKYSL